MADGLIRRVASAEGFYAGHARLVGGVCVRGYKLCCLCFTQPGQGRLIVLFRIHCTLKE